MAVLLCDVPPPRARPTLLEAVVTVTSTPPLNAGILLRSRIRAIHRTLCRGGDWSRDRSHAQPANVGRSAVCSTYPIGCGPIFRCHNSASKKTLDFPQNLENKGPEFFLPCRSMVLEVVRRKIFQTLELEGLSWCPSFAFDGAGLKLSKSDDYLLDNLCLVILSLTRG